MIDFSYTSEQNGIVSFVNDKGETVRTYPLSELDQFVIDKNLNISYEHDSEYIGHGDSNDPRNWDSIEREVYELPSDWLDDQDNFVSACEMFYKHKNPHEFKPFNREQETIRRVG